MIRAANVSLPSPLWGEGLGVRGDRKEEPVMDCPSPPTPLPKKGARGETVTASPLLKPSHNIPEA